MHAHDLDQTSAEIKSPGKKSTPRPDPWYKRFPEDYRRGTRKLSLAARGAYSDILDMIFMQGGPIPDDNKWIACELHVRAWQWLRIRQELFAAGKLILTPEGITNARAEQEIASRTLAKEAKSLKPRSSNVVSIQRARNSHTTRTATRTQVELGFSPLPNEIKGGKHTDLELDTELDKKEGTKLATKNPYPIVPETLASLNGAQELIIDQLATWINPLMPDKITAARTLTTQITLYGAPVVKQAFSELRSQIDSGDLVGRPIVVLNKACLRIKGTQDKAKVKKPSRW